MPERTLLYADKELCSPYAMSAFVANANGAADAFDPVRDDIATGFRPEAQALAPFADSRGAATCP